MIRIWKTIQKNVQDLKYIQKNLNKIENKSDR